jgi:hypothetical protein
LTVYNVAYVLTVEGLGIIDDLSYDDGRGVLIPVGDPGDDFSTVFPVLDGGIVRATADGTVQDGEITLSVTVTLDGQLVLSRSDSCESALPVECSLSIPFERFP